MRSQNLTFGKTCGRLLVDWLLTIFRGYTIATFWNWYIASVFRSASLLNVWTGIGISIFAAIFLSPSLSDMEIAKDKSSVEIWAHSIIIYALLWFSAGILHICMVLAK